MDIGELAPSHKVRKNIGLIPSHTPMMIKDDPISERAKILSATLNIPYSLAYDTQEVLSKEMDAYDNQWVQRAKSSFKFGYGNFLTNAGRVLEWAGLGGKISEYAIREGSRLQYAYAPPPKKEEFTFDKVLDPQWWAEAPFEQIPMWAGLLVPALLVGASFSGGAGAVGLGVFAKTILGALGAGATSRLLESAMEAGQTYDEQLRLGKSDEEAKKRANYTFERNLALAGLDVGQFALAFTPLGRIGLGDTAFRRALSVGLKLGGVGTMEAGEEMIQGAIQQAARGEKPHWGGEIKEGMALGFVFGAGLGGAGSVWNVLEARLKQDMPKNVEKIFKETLKAQEAFGKTKEEALMAALEAVAENPDGKKHIENTIKRMESKVNELTEEKIRPTEEEILESIEIEAKEIVTDEDIESIAQGQDVFEVIDDIELSEKTAEVEEEKTFISREMYEKSRAAISEKLKGFRAGLDPTILPHMIVVGAYHIEQGIRTFSKWSAEMIKEFGDTIKPHLRKIWKASNEYLEPKVPEKEVKHTVRVTTGQVKLSDIIREDKALSIMMKRIQENSKIAYKEGKREAIEQAKKEFDDILLMAKIKADILGFRQGMRVGSRLTNTHLQIIFKEKKAEMDTRRQEILSYIKENLPPDVRGKYLNAIIKHITPRGKERLFARVDEERKRLTRNELIAEIEELKRMRGDIAVKYQYEIRDIIGDIDTKKITSKTISRLQGLKDYIEEQGIPSGISTEDIQALSRLEMRQASEMTIEELQSLVDTAKKLTELGKLYSKLENQHNERIRKKNLEKLLESTNNLDPVVGEEKTMNDRVKLGLAYSYMETLQTLRNFDRIDGYKNYQGENAKLCKRIMLKEANTLLKIKSILDSAMTEMVEAGVNELTDEEKVRIMINIRFLEGAYDQVNTLMSYYGYDDIPVLTEKEKKVIEIIEKYMNADLATLIATYEKIEGKIFPKIPRYILPLKYVKEQFIMSPDEVTHVVGRTTHAPRGMTIERKLNVGKLPSIEIFDIFEHGINTVQWYINMEPELQNIRHLVKTEEYYKKAGQLAYNYWVDYLDIVARRGWSASASPTPFSSLLRKYRGNITKAVLGYKLSSVIMQPFAIFDAIAYAQSQFGTQATLEIIKEVTHSFINPKFAKEVYESSPMLETRAAGEVAVQELLAKIGNSNSNIDKFVKGGLSLLMWADIKTAAGVEAAFQKILEKHGVPNAKEEAGVLMTLVSSSSEVSYRPLILSRGEVARTVLTFQTFFLNRWGLLAHDLIAGGLIHGNWKAKYGALLGLAILAASKIAEDETREFLYETITGKEVPDNVSLFKRLLFSLPSNIPFFGNLYELGAYKRGVSEFPLAKISERLFRILDIFTKDEIDKKAKGFLASLEAFLTLHYGIPGTTQAFDVIERVLIPEEEKTEKKPRYIKPKVKGR